MPSGQILEVDKGSNLLRALQKHQIPVGSSCGGQGLCASCKVSLLSPPKGLTSPTDKESELSERNHLQLNERISCQCQVVGPITITTGYW